eukprot:487267-Lingulodinium_polyedra.AAC.1
MPTPTAVSDVVRAGNFSEAFLAHSGRSSFEAVTVAGFHADKFGDVAATSGAGTSGGKPTDGGAGTSTDGAVAESPSKTVIFSADDEMPAFRTKAKKSFRKHQDLLEK